MRQGVFVTGTDTGVGKTCVSLGLMRALGMQGASVAGLKPVASGCEQTGDGLRNADALQLQRASVPGPSYAQINPYAFAPAIAPHIAAAAAGVEIDRGVILRAFAELQAQVDWVVVEGVGGWYVPLGDACTMEDLAIDMGLPVVLVVGIRLGCLNHALLTEHAIRRSGLALAGWVANRIDPHCEAQDENIAAIGERIAAPLLADIGFRERGYGADQLAPLLDTRLLVPNPACA
jgi:dethiobiotin synthetase